MGQKVNYLPDTLRGYFADLIYANYFITKCKVHFHEKRHLFFFCVKRPITMIANVSIVSLLRTLPSTWLHDRTEYIDYFILCKRPKTIDHF